MTLLATHSTFQTSPPSEYDITIRQLIEEGQTVYVVESFYCTFATDINSDAWSFFDELVDNHGRHPNSKLIDQA